MITPGQLTRYELMMLSALFHAPSILGDKAVTGVRVYQCPWVPPSARGEQMDRRDGRLSVEDETSYNGYYRVVLARLLTAGLIGGPALSKNFNIEAARRMLRDSPLHITPEGMMALALQAPWVMSHRFRREHAAGAILSGWAPLRHYSQDLSEIMAMPPTLRGQEVTA